MKRFWGWLHDKLADLAIRIELWNYQRQSVDVSMTRSCGHRDQIRLRTKGLAMRVATYESTPCAECHFHEVMAEAKRRKA